MFNVNHENPGRSRWDGLRSALALLAVATSAFGTPSSAGQAGSSFNVTINLVPPTDSCTATVNGGQPLVNCRPTVVGGTGGGAAPEAGGLQGYRLPDARVKLVGAMVESAEENFHPLGEYSSRTVVADRVEYVEMTVTW
jgi:hypothetical protein